MEEQTIDLTELICDSINTIFFKFFSSIDNTIYTNLDNILFINSNITNNLKFQQFFGTDSHNGLLIIVNSLIIGLVLFYVLNFAVSHLIYTKVDSPYQFIFKCIIFISCAYSSFWICTQVINFVALVTDIIREIGKSITGYEISFSTLTENINSALYTSLQIFDIFTFDGIIKFCTSVATAYILIIYSIRYVMCMLLILTSPFAILSLVNNNLDGFFKGWLKQFLELLLIQILVTIVLVIGFCVDFYSGDLLSKLTYLAITIIIAKCHYNVKSFFKEFYNYSNNKLKDVI